MKEQLKLMSLSTLALLGGFTIIIKLKPIHDLLDTIIAFHIQVEVLVGLVAILTGAAGIIMSRSLKNKAHVEVC